MAQDLVPRHWTYDDLVLEFGEDDKVRHEIIDGELHVSAMPVVRHQRVVRELGYELITWTRQHGGEAFPVGVDTKFADDTVVVPDVIYFRPEHTDRIAERFVTAAPDLVVEVSSPSNRRWDRVRKLEVYQRFGVPEYWFVDLQKDLVEVFRLAGGRYPEPQVLVAGDVLTSPELPGFTFPVADLLSL